MNLYKIYSMIDNEAAYADLKQTDGIIDDFIVYDDGDYKEEAIFIAQEGYNLNNILQTDYIQTIPKMLLFSEQFKKKLCNLLKEELDFFPAKLMVQNQEFKFYLGKIKKAVPLVDMEKSNFYEIDGEKVIDYPPVFLKNVSGFEYCAKEETDDLIWVFSEKFKDLVLSNNLKIEFQPA
ncbi:MAG: hypothetical protein Q4D63_02485 [Neisseria animaloris]|nr:hypothetical protein [Neisseria animaloris]